jgi:hypothetical protein
MFEAQQQSEGIKIGAETALKERQLEIQTMQAMRNNRPTKGE